MDFNGTDLSNVRELLVSLARVLTPLVEGGFSNQIQKEVENLASHIFVPKETSITLPEYKVRLLKTLETAQKQIEKWVQEPKKTRSIEKGASPESPTSILSQARGLISQVRHAIQLLSSSSNLKSKPDDFQDALLPVKKWVDSLIEAVGRKEMPLSDHQKSSFPFRPLPRSPREDLLKKGMPSPLFPERKERQLPKEKTFRPAEKQESPIFFNRAAKEKEEKREVPFSMKNIPPAKPKEAQLPISDSEKPIFPPPSERTSLPGAPYTPPKPLLLKSKKRRKKRKGLWPEQNEDSPLDKA